MADEPRLLEVGSDSRPETINAGQRDSEAIVENESRELSNSEVSPNNVNATNEQGQADVSTTPKVLKVSKDTVKGVYVADTNRNTGFERSTADKKSIVNTITVDEVKQLLKELDAEIQARTDAIVETIRKGQYVVVNTTTYPTLESFLASSGEQGTVYLYPVGNVANNYYQYIWEVNQWVSLGTTQIDLSNYYAKNENLIPNTTNTYDLGSSSYNFKDLYLSGKTIFYSGYQIYKDGSTLRLEADGNNITVRGTFRPVTGYGGFYDLGSPSATWRNLYLSGKITDGTNSASVADLVNGTFNVINASDIVSNTLTQAQYDLITNGKPTLISGSFLSRSNGIILNLTDFGTELAGTFISGTYRNVIRINKTTLACSMATDSLRYVALSSILNINGKEVPAYPANTGTFVLKCVDGVLTWVAE